MKAMFASLRPQADCFVENGFGWGWKRRKCKSGETLGDYCTNLRDLVVLD